MCTGPGSPRCPEERLAWQIYDEHGYRPRELRPCLTAPRVVSPVRPRRRRGLLHLLTRSGRRASDSAGRRSTDDRSR